jgi:hypothetical protein
MQPLSSIDRRHPDVSGGFNHTEDHFVPGNSGRDRDGITSPKRLLGVVEVIDVEGRPILRDGGRALGSGSEG